MSRLPRGLLACLVLPAAAWMTLASLYWPHAGEALRRGMAVACAAAGLLALAGLYRARGRLRWMPALFALGLAGFLAAFLALRPQQQRDWADDVAVLLQADVQGSRVVLRGVRNFDWRGEADYTPRWETREYDLDRLVSADLVLSYWMGPHIAHTLVSFGFDDGQRVVFSLEIRKERGESFSALGGFFRNFEQVLVAADERDILRVRSNVRGEDVYLYRLNLPPEGLRAAFLGYLEHARQLRRRPDFYNTLTSNCTTIVFALARQLAPALPLDYRLLASGHFAEYAYDHGGLAPGFGYRQLQAAGRVTERARAADRAQDFSQRIRIGVPGADGNGIER